MAARPHPLVVSAAALGAAIDAAAAPVADVATLDARLEALGRAAADVAAASIVGAPMADLDRRHLARDVARARTAYARCLRRRATIGTLATVVTGSGAYASDGQVTTTSTAAGTVRRV